MSRLVLGIETSNPSAGDAVTSVAIARLHEDGSVTDTITEPLRSVARHADDLMPAIDRVVSRAELTPGEIDTVAVSAGPGGYTSIRVAIATAKLIAFGAHATTVAVPSAVALAHRTAERPLAIALAGKRDSAYVTVLQDGRSEASLMTETELRTLDARLLIADTFLPEPMRRAASDLGMTIVPPTFDALAVIEASHTLDTVAPGHLTPIYPREPDAVTQWRARHG